MNKTDLIQIADAPVIGGLAFRHFRGAEDYPKMAAVILASAEADQIERVTTAEEIANNYAHLTNCDPYQDMIFAESNGEVIGYSRGFWWKEENGPHIYATVGFLAPTWRRKGIGTVMLRWVENRMRAVAESHSALGTGFFQNFVDYNHVGLAALLEKNGYQPVRYFFQMVRPDLENIPDFSMPEGLELRPALPEHYRAIWDASNKAFRDHWGYATPREEDYQAWLGDKVIFQPQLWQVAWDVNTNEVAGMVRTFINAAENEKYKRQRGYTEFISVRRPWRRRGLARALIARSLQLQKEHGMTESALGTDSENLSGATRIYEACGFQVTKRNAIYRKAL